MAGKSDFTDEEWEELRQGRDRSRAPRLGERP